MYIVEYLDLNEIHEPRKFTLTKFTQQFQSVAIFHNTRNKYRNVRAQQFLRYP